MDAGKTLYERYNVASDGFVDFKSLTPSYISENLAYPLRPYQQEAIGRWMYYMDIDPNKKPSVQLLFNMATGSGKTLIMSALIIDLYKRGKRNFIFFVNSLNIIEKTKDNFLNPGSNKYLFAPEVIVDGEKIEIRSVTNFSDSDPNAINILFTTIHDLHSTLNNPRENKISYEDMSDYEIVMIGDEAHHNNAATMQSNKEKEDNASWESTVNNIVSTAKNPILLEFTATIDMDEPSIFQKYHDRVIYKYDLKAFRLDGYSKDPIIYSVDDNLIIRCLQAIVISQYRKKVAMKNGVWLKPVVMFKSRTISESEENYNAFNNLLENLTPGQIKAQKTKASDVLLQAFEYFDKNEITYNDLVDELKSDFCKERSVLIDGNHIAGDKQLLLNSLEDKLNEIRAVFAVDMLNEGWDVLNLFDIVRLYDTRDAKSNKLGKTTMREAQLIGRGARYYPFVVDDEDQKYTRKYDDNENEELRIIEQLHYHSAHNPKYIQEIRQALIKTGLMPQEMVERELRLKPEFIKTQTFKTGIVWVNKKLSRQESVNNEQLKFFEDEYELPEFFEITLKSGAGQELSVFDTRNDGAESVLRETGTTEISIGEGKQITPNIVRAAINRNKAFRFDRLSRAIIGLPSSEMFLKMLCKVKIILTGNVDEVHSLTQDQKLAIMDEVLDQIADKFKAEEEQFIGSKKFEKQHINEVFKDVKRKYTMDENSDAEFGMPQMQSSKYGLNLRIKDWYAYDENYGTSEEKSLVIMLDGLVDELSKKWDDIYLLRNEKAVTIYDFKEGRAFEPDYLLFANDKKSGNISWQIFIEPKGNRSLGADGTFTAGSEGWKEEFLKEIETEFNATVLKDDKNYKVIGLPFYNEDNTKTDIMTIIKDL